MNENDLIQQFFNKKEDLETIKSHINEIKNRNWGVGQDQLITTVILLSEGSIEKFKSLFPITDPRDTLMVAQEVYPDYFDE